MLLVAHRASVSLRAQRGTAILTDGVELRRRDLADHLGTPSLAYVMKAASMIQDIEAIELTALNNGKFSNLTLFILVKLSRRRDTRM